MLSCFGVAGSILAVSGCAFLRTRVRHRKIVDAEKALDDLIAIVDRLAANKLASAELVQKSPIECIQRVCEESANARCVLMNETLRATSNSEWRVKCVSELGRVLSLSLFAVEKVANTHGFDPSRAYRSAVFKVRGRTPYMPEWGDGSIASNATDAAAMWKARKSLMKTRACVDDGVAISSEDDPECTMMESAAKTRDTSRRCLEWSDVSARNELIFTVERLTAPDGCPWTSTHSAEALLRYLHDECEEAAHELQQLTVHDDSVSTWRMSAVAGNDLEGPRGIIVASLRSTNGSSQQFARVRAALVDNLVSELGDVLFNVFMAVYLSARDTGFQPVDFYLGGVESLRASSLPDL
eukprot:TRINITY_DN75004_c0_g1_i1.p1 TRINITY_DN75004_c0_g1~~TRINITY_DN75004_c0_g1_i1.p1  ORF type:complete len:364 (-),score=47.56 TRINITY_DN75004_c0_g1_i1:111-1172(-)